MRQDRQGHPFDTTGGHQKKVVIVDDSATIRSQPRIVLETDRRLRVVGEAETAQAAREVIRQTNPDVITLDIEMPGMNGLRFLEKLMTLRPTPVVMISGATRANSEATITALSLGAVDCLLKPETLADASTYREITRRVFSAACSTVQVQSDRRRPVAAAVTKTSKRPPIILVGASTGGVAALEVFLGDLPANGPPVVIVQHMPGTFLISFTKKLNRQLPQEVALARRDEPLGSGQIRLAPCLGQHTTISRIGGSWQCTFVDEPHDALHCPSVDALFGSAVSYADQVIGVILTGLGRDGAQGLLRLRQNGAYTLGQDAASSVVYGMPRAAFEMGAVCGQLPLNRLGAATSSALGRSGRRSVQ